MGRLGDRPFRPVAPSLQPHFIADSQLQGIHLPLVGIVIEAEGVQHAVDDQITDLRRKRMFFLPCLPSGLVDRNHQLTQRAGLVRFFGIGTEGEDVRGRPLASKLVIERLHSGIPHKSNGYLGWLEGRCIGSINRADHPAGEIGEIAAGKPRHGRSADLHPDHLRDVVAASCSRR